MCGVVPEAVACTADVHIVRHTRIVDIDLSIERRGGGAGEGRVQGICTYTVVIFFIYRKVDTTRGIRGNDLA